jgi:uncharacterized membrane protein
MTEHDERRASDPPAAPAGDRSFLGSLPAFPGNPEQQSELPPPKTSVVEAVAGAVLGAVVGPVGGLLAGGGVLAVLLGLVVGAAVGALFGLLVAKVSGRIGTLTAGNVLWAMPRIVLWAVLCPLIPIYIVFVIRYGSRAAGDRLDRWDRDVD